MVDDDDAAIRVGSKHDQETTGEVATSETDGAQRPNSAGKLVNGPDGDQVTPYGRKAVFAATLGYAMDGFDLQILGFALPAIT
jgi:hypothetical protein